MAWTRSVVIAWPSGATLHPSSRPARRSVIRFSRPAALATVVVPLAALSLAHATPARAASPIQHVVYLLQENHSFDNVLGAWCVQTGRCDGATSGLTSAGRTIPLSTATDTVVDVPHSRTVQTAAIDGGAMDGFNRIPGCGSPAYKCYTQYQPSQIPNLIALASSFAVSDRTFELDAVPSWGAHLDTVSASLDNFYGPANPVRGTAGPGPGWGCDSRNDVGWTNPSGAVVAVPSCVPDYNLDPAQYPFGGAYRATPVQSIPTIMDRLDGAGLPWKLYVDLRSSGGNYGWSICPTFAGCLYTSQVQNMVSNTTFLADARAGALPAFSVVTPEQVNSQHNSDSMAVGDNWIGAAVSAIENGPDWSSTAIFIGYDDCGCFYDHVAPPAGLGLRVPMVLVSPYVKAGYTDSTPASFASVLAFTEHTFGLAALAAADAGAYDYSAAFDYSQAPRSPFRAVTTAISAAARRALAAHPPDPTDPT